MNKQRETIYRKRKNALFGDKLAIDISDMFYDVCVKIVERNYASRDYDGFVQDIITTFGCETPFTQDRFFQEKTGNLVDEMYDKAFENYKVRQQILCKQAFPVIKNVYLENGERFSNIAIPITDGVKTLNVVAPLKKCYETEGREIGLAIEKGITLAVIDNAWKEHLREMDDLKQSVQNASYEQKDPLLIYKLESFNLFDMLLEKINEEIVSFLNKGGLPVEQHAQVREAQLPQSEARKLQTGRSEVGGHQVTGGKGSAPVRVEKKVGRNDPCPCGSGKKYKNCHGREG
jgi:preprotein translocase subunit SecA